MRADRLLGMLLLLQRRGRMTAAELAAGFEVSIRTIYRDVEALAISGVPVRTVRGPRGGIELVDGFRTELTGLTVEEVSSLLLARLLAPAAALGIDEPSSRAESKVLEAIPVEVRARADAIRHRVHHDPEPWHPHDRHTLLTELADALWRQRAVQLRWEGPDALREEVQPLGLVLKAGDWWLVAVRQGRIACAPVDDLAGPVVRSAGFDRPDPFDLAAFWRQWVDSAALGTAVETGV